MKIDARLASPLLYSYVEANTIRKLVSYIIHWKTRKAVKLSNWIKKQVLNQDTENAVADYTKVDYSEIEIDTRCIKTLEYVAKKLMYFRDSTQGMRDQEWVMPEYWQTAIQTIKANVGDCEDGAILLYNILRVMGVPANRLLICAGNVNDPRLNKKAGHCWLAYKPSEYPLNWVFLDWCYYVDTNAIEQRPLYTIRDKKITANTLEQGNWQKTESNYIDLWFAFNENVSFTGIKTKR